MKRTLRGAWSRRGTLLPLLLLTVVVVAGAVTVLGFADSADTSPMLAVPLLLLGAVALPATGRELAAARRGEIALARLRGLHGGQLAALLLVEPLVVLALGAALGVVLGGIGTWLAGTLWIDSAAGIPGLSAVLTGIAIVVVGLVAVLIGMTRALGDPLSEQVSIASRPRTASTAAVFAGVLVIVAAVVAVYRGAGSTGDPDLVVLAGPALVGLAIGQAVLWLIRLVARAAVGLTVQGALPGFLAARRLARVADAASPVRILVAASVVAALAMTGSGQVDDWTDETARLRAGAPIQVPLDADAPGALALTRDLDPEGRWLMAAVLVPGEGSVPARRAFLDTTRYEAVIGDFYGGTAAARLAGLVSGLGGEESGLTTDDRVIARVAGVSSRLDGELRPQITVTYRDERGRIADVRLSGRVPLDGGAVEIRGRLSRCSRGCTLTGLALGRSPSDEPRPWVLTSLDFGGREVVSRRWNFLPLRTAGALPVSVERVDEGLLVPVADRPLTALADQAVATLRVLATDSATWEEQPMVDSTGGDERTAEVVGRLPALPLVEADGVLADLSSAVTGAPPTVPAAEVMVLARSNTPDGILSALSDAAGHEPRTLAGFEDSTAAETGAVQARVYSVMAIFCLVVGLLVVGAGVARQRAAWLRQVAALRVIGVSQERCRRAGRVEVLWLTAATVLASAVGAVLAVRLLLGHLSLVTTPLHSVPLRTEVALWPVLLAAAAVAAVVVLVTGRGLAVRAENSRPAILREEGTA